MNQQNLLSPVSVGSLVKKILAIDPTFQVQDIVQAIRQATETHDSPNEGFGARETIDEELALKIARIILNAKNKSKK